MVRGHPIRLLVAGALASMLCLLSGCCAGSACGRTAYFEIFLDASRAVLDGGELTLCRGTACSSGKPTWSQPEDGWEQGMFDLVGDLPTARTYTTVIVTPDGRSRIQASAPIERSGEQFDIRFIDAQGTALLDFSRNLLYDHKDICGQDCPAGAIRVWPTSPSGLTCSARTCASGVGITTEGTLSDTYAGNLTYELCRNDVCRMWRAWAYTCAGDAAHVNPDCLGGDRRKLSSNVTDDPALLADGDHYQLTITDDQMNVVASVDKTVVYSESFPNGTECDPFPCRWAEIGP